MANQKFRLLGFKFQVLHLPACGHEQIAYLSVTQFPMEHCLVVRIEGDVGRCVIKGLVYGALGSLGSFP